MKTTNISQVRTSNMGVYVWKLPNGLPFTDGEGNLLNVPSRYGDIVQMAKLARAAAYYGQPDGTAEFMASSHRCTDEELMEQLDTMDWT